LSNLKGIVITGSVYSTLDDTLPWLNRLIELLQNIHNNFPLVKFIGICFGHQILAKAFGGLTGKNPSGQFIYKLEKFSCIEEFENLPRKLKVAESHGDCVTQIPPTATLLYSSDSCQVEMLRYGNRIVSI